MITFMRNKQTGRFDVIGPANEVIVGSVVVRKKDGSETIVRVNRVSKSFSGKFGPLAGQQCRIGTVAPAVEYRRSRSQDDDTVRCRHCRKYTLSGDDWCMECGRADYE